MAGCGGWPSSSPASGCTIYDFDQTEEKSEKYFPEFAEIRGDMYEESIRFFTDLFQRDASLLSLFNADHTFVNQRLAEFYGIEGVQGGDWQRIQVAQEHGRGGILALGTTLSKQSGRLPDQSHPARQLDQRSAPGREAAAAAPGRARASAR